ncbi:hypothetical protein CC86DRAFT_389698 [Ophiobolus disseminans]|uniref:Uncharacterized protein n=1 Tax=Ophiobolus disseminans TaxID=1469910 RepID=A0A6A7AKF5_9PLEO|nr:hypothetical protein CC86DRAFT_389698 [Ophiobolus disseminans]
MMGTIYARALNVKIWLGKEDKEAPNLAPSNVTTRLGTNDFAYGKMPIVLSFLAQALRNSSGPENRLAATKPMEDSAHRNIAYGFPPPDAPEWNTVREFFVNSWFDRVWVLQEVVLASKATALIGDWEIEWAAIGEAAMWFQSKGYAVPAVSRLATNPADKVYATFGMAAELSHMEKHGFHQLVEPNYTSKTVLDVYRDIAKYLIIEHGNLDVLSHAGTSLLSEWPSWVPDWRYDKASNALATSGSAAVYNASKNQLLSIDISNKFNAISIQGVEVDTVMLYGDRLASHGVGFVTYQEEIDFVRMAWALISQHPSTMYEDTAAMLIQTLTAGLSNSNRPASEDPSFQADALHWFAQHAPRTLPTAPLSQRFNWSIKQRADSGRFHEAFVRACVDRRLFVTRGGLIGIGPHAMKEGDIVVILFGGRVPYILRPIGMSYKYIGECYVPGLMNGEAVTNQGDDNARKRTFFELV